MQFSKNKKSIVIKERHHQVLKSWYFLSQKSGPAELLTLDYHLDTAMPFRKILSQSNPTKTHENFMSRKIDAFFANPSFEIDGFISDLNNDEHIIAALKLNILARVFIINHNTENMCDELFREHKLLIQSIPFLEMNNGSRYAEVDQILETSFLEPAVVSFGNFLDSLDSAPIFSMPLILDIDLDYFRSLAAIEPKDPSYFLTLVERADLITIATEPDFVQRLRLKDDVDSEILLEKLLNLIGTSVSYELL